MPLSKISRIIVVLPVTVLLGGCYQICVNHVANCLMTLARSLL